MFTIHKEKGCYIGNIEFIFWNVREDEENHHSLAYQYLCENWDGFKDNFIFDPSRRNMVIQVITGEDNYVVCDSLVIKDHFGKFKIMPLEL